MEGLWKKIDDSNEVMCFEKKLDDISIRLEARKMGSEWVVYRGFYSGTLNHTEEYSVSSIDDAKKMLFQLKEEKAPSVDELQSLVKDKAKRPRLTFKRAYREDNLEKWFFSINEGESNNFFIVREDENVEIDLVLNEKYKDKSENIMNDVVKMLSLEGLDVDYNVYYFSKSKKKSQIMKLEFDVNFISEE